MSNAQLSAQPALDNARPTASVRATVRAGIYTRAFAGLLLRDARVLVREIVPFLIRTIMNPLLFVFVFTYVFPLTGHGISGGEADFTRILVPGLVAASLFFPSITGVAMPLSVELGGTREIEDRLMAPLPVSLVAIEKIVFSSFQSIMAAIIVFPLVSVVPVVPVSVHVASWPLLISVALLSTLATGALGLSLGTLIPPKQIGLIFSTLVMPLTFLGCVYYSWTRLASIRWLQIAVLVNPVVYVSEGLRAALTPDVPHMPPAAFLGALLVASGILVWIGVRSFVRRVIS
ncbi:MAG: ABC transporter permease [Egibacteraceae bacterium]